MVNMLNNQILIVDDNAINRQYFSMSLKKSGYTVSTVESGIDAISISNTEKFDIILMDIRMPGMDGYEAAKQIRQLKYHEFTPIIATSAEYISPENQNLFNDFLLKPISPRQLQNNIEKHCPTCIKTIVAFNLENALKYAYNDKQIMQKLITLFINELPKSLAQLEPMVNNKDNSASRELIHKIRGSCRTCGAEELDRFLAELNAKPYDIDAFNRIKCAANKYINIVNNL